MPTTLRIKRRSSSTVGAPSTLASSELAFNETSGGRVLYYGLGNDGYGTATSVIAIGGPDFNSPITLSGVITSNSSGVTTITSQTGTGSKFVVDTSPTLITPTIGVATATSVNKVTITQPATSATLTIADGATLSVPSTGSISGTNTGDNAINTLYSSLVSNATHTGDATGSTALTVVRINGQSLAALATGLLKNTTSTGVPTIAIAGTDYVIPSGSITGNAANVTGTVAIANGGTGQITQQTAINALTGTQSSGKYLRSDGTNSSLTSIQAADVPTLNQNTTGSSGSCTGNAANVTGVVAILNGGTGQTTQQAAINALTGTQSAGKFLRSDGTNATLSSITAADVPTLSGVITSNSSGVTSITSQTGTGTKFVTDTSPTLITPNIGVASGTSLTLSGNLVVNGSTISLNATNLEIVDKNIILGNAASPSEVTADGGGITLKGATDHTFNYVASTTAWTSSENLNLASGKTLKINGTTVLSATALIGVDIDGGSF
jgi:hypothetical protein